ncbi:DNA-3-methyladenine glycosylase [Forsythia ovata]|uniref:DNA-3-methyladenine glycosylase II n=1 Tax=Forsythia ovata TaxID=205694 RepID=A0ABD1NYB0_9LAMI
MNKRKTPQCLEKLTQLTNPIKTIEKSIKVKHRLKRKNNSNIKDNGAMIPSATQSPSSFCYKKWAILAPDFYQIDALDLAPRLLGKFLKKDDVVLQITEVEAYRPNDSACHARFGITSRTAPVFGPGGHTYVYLCYGLHTMLNVVADKEGVGAAVLIRSCAPVSGLEIIQQRRGLKTEKPVLLTGPGKVGQALGISTEWSNQPLFNPGGLELLDGPEPEKILVGPRVGIEYASPEHVTALWRFAIAGTPWISAPKNTLKAP